MKCLRELFQTGIVHVENLFQINVNWFRSGIVHVKNLFQMNINRFRSGIVIELITRD
jgi:hypothetical protein